MANGKHLSVSQCLRQSLHGDITLRSARSAFEVAQLQIHIARVLSPDDRIDGVRGHIAHRMTGDAGRNLILHILSKCRMHMQRSENEKQRCQRVDGSRGRCHRYLVLAAVDAHAHAAELLSGSRAADGEGSQLTGIADLGEHPAVLVARHWHDRGIDPNRFIMAHPARLQLITASPGE